MEEVELRKQPPGGVACPRQPKKTAEKRRRRIGFLGTDPGTEVPGKTASSQRDDSLRDEELSVSLLRHFVPGYYQPVPPGQKPIGVQA
jgi:hypothetical protein